MAHSVALIQPSSNMFKAKMYLIGHRTFQVYSPTLGTFSLSTLWMPLHSEHQQHRLIQGSPTCRCRRSAHKPGRGFPLRWAGEQEAAAAASSFGSYRNRSGTCRTSARGPGTSSAAGYWLWSEGSPVREPEEMVQLDFWWGLLWWNQSAQPLSSPSRCSATCSLVLSSPPSPNRPTEGVWRRSISQQLYSSRQKSHPRWKHY